MPDEEMTLKQVIAEVEKIMQPKLDALKTEILAEIDKRLASKKFKIINRPAAS